jgi:hypothetical protein
MTCSDLNPQTVVPRDGIVYYVIVKDSEGREFVEHVGILGRGHSPVFSDGYTIPVYDWPIDSRDVGRNLVDKTRIFSTIECANNKRFPFIGLCFAWPENGLQRTNEIDLKLVYETAKSILEIVLRSFGEKDLYNIHSILYMLDPAMDPNFSPSQTNPLERFFRGSCVGFVEHCFEHAGLPLVDMEKLPILQSRDNLSQLAVGRFFLFLDERAVSKNPHRLFTRDFPLALLFPGYLCSAMTDDKAYPFSPSLAHAEGR